MRSLYLSVCLTLIMLIHPTIQALTLSQYAELQQETPQIIFHPLQLQPQSVQSQSSVQKLLFVTPWNVNGYDLAVKYAKKFKYISPCWYDLSFQSDHIIIENDKLYNQSFLTQIRAANPGIKILPRFYISSNQHALLHSIGSFQNKFKNAIGLIVTLIENQKFDGLVWDSPFNTMHKGEKYTGIRNLIVQFVNSIRMNLGNGKLLFFNMANPMGIELADQMYQILNVNCIMIQNYDNDKYIQMVQKSLNWIKSNKFNYRPKFMLLLPFFSRRGGQGIDTRQIEKLYIKSSEDSSSGKYQKQKLAARIQNNICSFYQYSKRMQSFVPCYTYFSKVFAMIEKEREKEKDKDYFKIGFWEGGNGLQNYYKFL